MLLQEGNVIYQEGDRKIYLAPDAATLQKVLSQIPGSASGEYSRSKLWNQVSIEDSNRSLLKELSIRLRDVEEKLIQLDAKRRRRRRAKYSLRWRLKRLCGYPVRGMKRLLRMLRH